MKERNYLTSLKCLLAAVKLKKQYNSPPNPILLF